MLIGITGTDCMIKKQLQNTTDELDKNGYSYEVQDWNTLQDTFLDITTFLNQLDKHDIVYNNIHSINELVCSNPKLKLKCIRALDYIFQAILAVERIKVETDVLIITWSWFPFSILTDKLDCLVTMEYKKRQNDILCKLQSEGIDFTDFNIPIVSKPNQININKGEIK